ncbi:MAG TPA: sugar ABC transporter substrate-binding protein [Firmicutes bacterium]|jgi:raffinose/stachyose/melibiose transport system substrate-binding protein|nr:sugar ABC transporter substrate-binding protein [Bacillota bacterium]
MVKKLLVIVLPVLLLITLFGGITAFGQSPDKPATIKMFLNSPEYTNAYNAFVTEYKKVKPNVTIDLQVMQADYPTILKTKIASGDIPDIFMTTAGAEIKQYAEYSADLTKEPLAGAMIPSVRNNVSYGGKVLGAPIASNLFAIIYNKDLFAKAGITKTPKTLTELKADCDKLQSKGITPFANGYMEWWVYKHIFQHFVDASSNNISDSSNLVNAFISGKTTFQNHPTLTKFFNFINLTVTYGTPKALEKDFSAETSEFATGKAAMMTGQGGWAEEGIVKINPNIKIGIMGYPINDDPNKSAIILGSGAVLRVNKDSKVLEETKDFINWLYTSEYGKEWFAKTAKAIPPITQGKYPDMQMVNDMRNIMKTDKIGDEAIIYSLDSFHQKFGEIIQAYIGKGKTRAQAISDIQKAWTQLGAAK